MAVVSVTPIEGSTFEEDRPIWQSISEHGGPLIPRPLPQCKYSLAFWVQCDDIEDTAATVMIAEGLPQIDDAFPGDISAYCVKRAGRHEPAGPLLWRVQCDYETWVDPVLEDPVWEMHFARQGKLMTVDRDGNPVINSAKLPFVPGVDAPHSNPIITVQWAQDEITDPNLVFRVVDGVNNAEWATPWGTFPTGSAKCTPEAKQRKKKDGSTYLEIKAVVEILWGDAVDSGGWIPWKVLDASLYQLDGSGKQVPIRDRNQQPISQPVPIDSSGHQIDPSTLPGAAQYKSFNFFRSVDFSSFIPAA